MRRNLVVVALLVFGSTAFGQDERAAGSTAFLAYVNSNLNISLFGVSVPLPTAGVGLRYWSSPTLVIVPSVAFGINNMTEKGQGGWSDEEDNTTSFGLGVAIESHMRTTGSVRPYWKAGVGLNYVSNTSKPSLPPGTPFTGQTLERSSSSTPLSVMGGLGLEAIVTTGVSVGFSYEVSVSFGGGKTTTKSQGQPDTSTETSTFGLNLGTSNVWISIML